MLQFLSKSDFKVAQSCPTKLFYKKNGYPTTNEENEYLLMLADGGYMIGKMAQLLFENGIDISSIENTDLAIQATEQYLEQENIVLFEPAIYVNNKLIRIDILIKDKNTFHLIEVKSKSFDSTEYNNAVNTNKKYFEKVEWTEYVEDVAFQKFVLQEKYPSHIIKSFLLIPDKSKTTPIEGLADCFKIVKTEIVGQSRFRKTDVEFTGNLSELKQGHILAQVNIDAYVDNVMPQVIINSQNYINSIIGNSKIISPINSSCSKCEYRIDYSVNNGFNECWKELAEVNPHILDLAYLGNFNRTKDKPIDKLISEKKVNLQDVPVSILENKYNNRSFYQVTAKKEFLLDDFNASLEKVEYPIHFIDFETSQMAIPYHANMRPYGKVIFQWSCHTIQEPNSLPVHSEWINVIDKYPNFEFAKSLKETLGDKGTIMIWSLYENTMLKDVFNSMEHFNYEDESLKKWLSDTIQFSKGGNTRLLDLNELALKYYFHPLMGGKTSIKKTLPAVLNSSKSMIIKSYLENDNLYKLDEKQQVIDPYSLLPKIEVANTILDVTNGTDAMIAYQEMMYGASKENNAVKEGYKKSLLQYCKLDTLAMVIIWEHWKDIYASK